MPSTLLTEEIDAALERSAVQNRCWEEYLEEQKRRLAYLQALEKQFLATRDMRFLEEFKNKIPCPRNVELAEKVEHPCTIWPEEDALEEVRDDPHRLAIRKGTIDRLDAGAMELNPNVKIRHIKGKENGRIYRVWEGVDCEEWNALDNLRAAEQKMKQKIEQLASNCAPPNYTARITQEKLTTKIMEPAAPSR